MAKRGAKADAIREFIEQNPEAKAADVVKGLAGRRIKVSPTQVYGIMSKPNGHSKTNGQAAEPPTNRVEAVKSLVSDMPLIHAKEFIVASGGLNQARKVLDFIESLQLSK